jgi:uncharacterized protein YjbJ (UPF0337 family)
MDCCGVPGARPPETEPQRTGIEDLTNPGRFAAPSKKFLRGRVHGTVLHDSTRRNKGWQAARQRGSGSDCQRSRTPPPCGPGSRVRCGNFDWRCGTASDANLKRGNAGDFKMDENRLSGTAKNLGGKVEEGLGRVTGDARTQAQGQMKQAEGSVQDLYGQTRLRAGHRAS